MRRDVVDRLVHVPHESPSDLRRRSAQLEEDARVLRVRAEQTQIRLDALYRTVADRMMRENPDLDEREAYEAIFCGNRRSDHPLATQAVRTAFEVACDSAMQNFSGNLAQRLRIGEEEDQ
jgi:hypothetical protein